MGLIVGQVQLALDTCYTMPSAQDGSTMQTARTLRFRRVSHRTLVLA